MMSMVAKDELTVENWQRKQHDRILKIMDQITFNDWTVALFVPHPFNVRHSPYLQVVVEEGVDNVTGQPKKWKGRKWQLSYHMTETEIVRTAYLAVQKAVEHETAELFKYRGVAPYNPHFHIGDLVRLAEIDDLDGRTPGPTFET